MGAAPSTPQKARVSPSRKSGEVVLGPNGKPLTNKERRKLAQEAERARYMDKKSIEQFVINVYATCPRIESMWLILSNIMGQRAFGNFVSSETADEYFNLFMRISTLNSTNNPSFYILKMRMMTLVEEFFSENAQSKIAMSSFLEKVVEDIKTLDPEDTDFHVRMFVCMENVQNEMVYLMAKEQFNRFIVSKQYKQWRASESSHAAAFTTNQFSDKDLPSDEAREAAATKNTPSFKKEARLKNSKIIAPVDLSYSAFANVDQRSVGEILGTESWLATLVAAVEGLPVCFSLAKAIPLDKLKPMEKPFPLIYVNKYFSKVTGYAASYCKGKPCKDFLQCKESEKEEVMRMSASLKSAVACVARVHNVTQQGVVFFNLVALKPIFDAKGEMVFVVGLHFDITKENDGGDGKENLAQELMQCIPSVLKIKEEGEEDETEDDEGDSSARFSTTSSSASSSARDAGDVPVKARMASCVVS